MDIVDALYLYAPLFLFIYLFFFTFSKIVH